MSAAVGVPPGQVAPRAAARAWALYETLNARGLVWPPLVLAVALPVGTLIGDSEQLKWMLWISYGLLALSLDFVWGRAGIFSFGQTAMFGLGGYAYGIITINYFAVLNESWTALVGAVVVGALFAGLLGYFMFYGRLGDVYLAIITLAVTLVLYTVLASTAGPEYAIGDALLGGFNGMPGLAPITLQWPGGDLAAPLDNYYMLLFAVVAATLVYVALRIFLASPYGRVLTGIRENELRMELLGYDVRRHKLLAFAIGGAIAGLGGGLFAAWGTFMNPNVFTLGQAALVVIYVMVGGRGSLWGAFLGVIVIEWITERADDIKEQQTPLILGAILILVVLLVPGGIVPGLRWLGERARRLAGLAAPRAPVVATAGDGLAATDVTDALTGVHHPELEHAIADAVEGEAAPAGEVVLATSELTKRFGGVLALDHVTVEFRSPGAHAVIGPNGAGKSTFFNVVIGRHSATEGRVRLGARDVTELQTFQRARLGLGIKLQVPSLFYGLTVGENIWLATYAAAEAGKSGARADEVLAAVGLLGRAEVVASELSHGEQQWLEIAMVIAAQPSTILLDEPTGGMTREEKAKTVELVRGLARDHTVVVVEHDMEFVSALGVPVTMFHQGKVFRSGSFDEIRSDQVVIDVYLGRSGSAESA